MAEFKDGPGRPGPSAGQCRKPSGWPGPRRVLFGCGEINTLQGERRWQAVHGRVERESQGSRPAQWWTWMGWYWMYSYSVGGQWGLPKAHGSGCILLHDAQNPIRLRAGAFVAFCRKCRCQVGSIWCSSSSGCGTYLLRVGHDWSYEPSCVSLRGVLGMGLMGRRAVTRHAAAIGSTCYLDEWHRGGKSRCDWAEMGG
jgi:hypothetical protein